MESQVRVIQRRILELKEKVWSLDEPDKDVALHQLACLQSEVEELLLAITDSLEIHIRDCRSLIDGIKESMGDTDTFKAASIMN